MESEEDVMYVRSKDWMETMNFSTRIDHIFL